LFVTLSNTQLSCVQALLSLQSALVVHCELTSRSTQSDGSELGCVDGYEQTSISVGEPDTPTKSPRSTLQVETVSFGEEAPVGNGSVFCCCTVHEVFTAVTVTAPSHLSDLLSLHV
jgi:hypothetical protein